MADPLKGQLVIAITSRALFDLRKEHRIFVEKGLVAYRAYQRKAENKFLKPGTAFPLVKALLAINKQVEAPLLEVLLISKNDADSGVRIFNSLEHSKLKIIRAAFTDGRPTDGYLESLECNLFLSAERKDVVTALEHGIPAARVYPPPKKGDINTDEVRIAFDGDAVLFSAESERIFREKGLKAFQRYERLLEDTPLRPGPLKGFLEKLSQIQRVFDEEDCPIRTALVTARSAPAHKRPINTLRAWKIRLDESFFLGGIPKEKVLKVLRPHIFFDDQPANLKAWRELPVARVHAH